MPDTAALLEAVRMLRAAQPGLGVKQLVARLRAEQPGLGAGGWCEAFAASAVLAEFG